MVGGESGPGSRPCEVSWVRDVVEQCRHAGVKVFTKQLGDNAVGATGERLQIGFKGKDSDRWPADLRVREFP
jgi:protein gp37